MGVYFNPKIINDNLVLYYDTSNIKSYLGEPTTSLASGVMTQSTNTTVSNVSVVNPFGTTGSVQRLIASNGGLTGVQRTYLPHTIGIPSTATYYTVSMWIKKENANDDMTAGWEAECDAGDSYARPNIELGYTGVYNQNPQTQTVSSTWVRVAYTFKYTVQRTSNVVLFFYISGTGAIYTTGYQVEEKDHMTQYLSSVTSRSAANGLRDLSGYGHHTSLTGAQFDKDSKIINSVSGSNLQIDASTTILQNLTNNGNSHTYECWYKPLGNVPYSPTASDGYIFGRRGNHSGFRQGSGSLGNQIFSAVLWFSDGSNTGVGSTYTTSLSSWNHLVLTVDEVNHISKAYINGIQSGNDVILNKDLRDYTTAPYFIGTGSNASFPYIYSICGMVDCCRLYSKALTQDEVTQNFNAMRSRFGR